MKETRNNCFGSKIRSKTLPQAKTGKHECRILIATHKTLYVVHCCRFVHMVSYAVIIQSVIQSYLETPVCGASLSYMTEMFRCTKQSSEKYH